MYIVHYFVDCSELISCCDDLKNKSNDHSASLPSGSRIRRLPFSGVLFVYYIIKSRSFQVNYTNYCFFIIDNRRNFGDFGVSVKNHIIDFYRKFLPTFLPNSLFFEILYFVLSVVTLYSIIIRLWAVTCPEPIRSSFSCHVC